jgi:hypothetical protein
MELCLEKNLKDFIEDNANFQGKKRIRKAKQCIREISAAVVFIHSQNLIHRYIRGRPIFYKKI